MNDERRLPPHSAIVEQHVLAVCLIDEGQTLKRAKDAGITDNSFFLPENRTVWTALNRCSKPDFALLIPELGEDGLRLIGGGTYLTQIQDAAGSTAFAGEMIAKLRESEQKRLLIRQALETIEHAHNGTSLAELQAETEWTLKLLDVQPKSGGWPLPIAAAKICLTPPPTPAVLIEGILYRGGTMLISGPSKSHKTYTMLDAALAIASGRPWLGFPTSKVNVLYINLELQDFAISHRIEKICQAASQPPPTNLHVWNLRGQKVTIDALSLVLAQKIKELEIGLVIVDPHYKISSVSGHEENSNDDQGALLSALEGLCGLNGAALMICHHFAKGDASAKNAIDRASGGGVFARWGDVMMTFSPHEEEDAMTVEMSLRNFAPVEPFVATWNHPRWSTDNKLDPTKLKQRGGSKERHSADSLLNCLGEKSLNFTDWLDASGLTESTFKRKRNDLLDAGKIVQEMGFYRKA